MRRAEEVSMTAPTSGERCVACRKDAPRVTDAELAEWKPTIPDWELNEVDGELRLERAFRFKTYPAALAFVQRVGEAAEAEGHHPVMVVEARRVRVSWWTHAIGWLHRNDFIMAARTDRLFAAEQEGG
jgi:4a-hydroxytetrahydrobiopterin dehydratase